MDGFNLPLHQERNAFFVFVQINFHKDNLFFMKIEIIKLGVVTVGLVFLPKFYYFILFSPMTQLFVLFFWRNHHFVVGGVQLSSSRLRSTTLKIGSLLILNQRLSCRLLLSLLLLSLLLEGLLHITPLLADLLALFLHISVPQGTNDKKNETSISEDDGEQPADDGEAVEGLVVAIRSVFGRALGDERGGSTAYGSRPPFEILENVSGRIQVDEESGTEGEVERTPSLPMRFLDNSLSSVTIHVDS